MKCAACQKQIHEGLLISGDGDFVCDEKCRKAFYKEMDTMCKMSDSEFEAWLTGETK